MKISDLGEFGLIEKIRKSSSPSSPAVVIGIGDDAAALRIAPATLLLATTDMLIEGVHFDLSYTDFYSLGWKSAAVNLSDIAAMGGVPRFCLTSLGIPSRISVERISDFYRGFNALARTHKTILAGGDTCFSRNSLVISVTVLGEAKKRTVLTRSGARRGDKIFVTGTLGDSGAGLEILKSGVRDNKREKRGEGRETRDVKNLIQKHLRPAPRVAEGRKIALAGCASSMIDISDGLSSDLAHICGASGAGALIFSDAIPLSESLLKSSSQLSKPPLHYALSGGEDYELLFTVPPGEIRKLHTLGIALTEIGEVTRTRKMLIVDVRGKRKPLKATGYNHFERSRGE